MSKKIDERLPGHIGEGMLPGYAAIKTPWEKLIGYRDAMHYAARYRAVISAAIMQALRIVLPDYAERAKLMCEDAYARLLAMTEQGVDSFINNQNMHPFFRGNFPGALIGDKGDDAQLMCGRVNDFGTYRAEKELDVCDWDVVGSELCRATTMSLQGNADGVAKALRPGPRLEFHMVEAKGCGDRHCRIVAECREKYPMPPHEIWEAFGPVGSADQIKFTPEEECVRESDIFREETNYAFINGTNAENNASSAVLIAYASAATLYILPTARYAIGKGLVEEKFFDHVLRCVCEAAGKTAFGEAYTKEALRQWLNVPRDIGDDDGRVMGAHIEMYLQSVRVPYEIEAFNKDEVVYVIDRNVLTVGELKFADALVAYWYGMTKTLVNPQWSLWEEAGDIPADKLRIKIAKKIDKFC
ncbi:MAG: hypothetical protein LBH51_09700 [Treponema sp.]|jgi:hypothetical protein|nr:hypothetical protein [Treponema sp.]